ncbi:wax ester/triacylglycerol synthase domain-containing protein [Xylanimonas ulmi]|uniref:Wax ester synthase-like acyl-CoA acyltransferase family protein n=1 Tax=Xylanimonas ulmi TaxID=228973 RepID=A0A4Q7M7I3_9MICO|nr:wax ester/triacylglycerol synthase domain-containing protein [Xylanibacterium ulmi]RZS62618.1 wax ester synthase-like acyl-CoA acyltransferase family protein [Xylanibacterium ulmi]
MRDRRPVSVELLGTLDEKFVANAVVFEHATPCAGLLLAGERFRTPSGSLDHDLVLRALADGLRYAPELRRRLRPAPLGLTTPAWVPDDALDVAAHVRFHPGVVAADGPDLPVLLAGRLNPPLDPRRPLWNTVVAELDDGRLAVAWRIQHAVGDGLYGLRLLDALTEADAAAPALGTHRPPRSGVELLRFAGAAWWRRQAGPRAAWHEYWRKPFRRRLRRWAGRVVRPVRNRVIAARGLAATLVPRRRYAFAVHDLAPVARRARELGGSVHDLTVAAALVALDQMLPDPAGPRLGVPLSHRAARGDRRNHVRMTVVGLPPGTPLAEAVPLVHAAVADAIKGTGPSQGIGPGQGVPGAARVAARGYASFVPWRPRVRHLGPAAVRGAVLWPVLDPRDDIAVFGSSYADTFALAVVGSTSLDVDAVLRVFAEQVIGADRLADLTPDLTGGAP